MNKNIKYVTRNTGFCNLLAIVFIALKLTDHIDWSWWWVLSPLWIPWIIVLVILIFVFLVFAWANWK